MLGQLKGEWRTSSIDLAHVTLLHIAQEVLNLKHWMYTDAEASVLKVVKKNV